MGVQLIFKSNLNMNQGAGLAQWREHLPPTDVARVWFWAQTICGLSLLLVLSLLQEVFPRVLRVFPFPQKPALPNSNSTRNARTVNTWASGSGDWATTPCVIELKQLELELKRLEFEPFQMSLIQKLSKKKYYYKHFNLQHLHSNWSALLHWSRKPVAFKDDQLWHHLYTYQVKNCYLYSCNSSIQTRNEKLCLPTWKYTGATY